MLNLELELGRENGYFSKPLHYRKSDPSYLIGYFLGAAEVSRDLWNNYDRDQLGN